MKITVLCNDKALTGFRSEHGLSLLIEINGRYYLFDAGSTDVALKNAEKLNIDISKIEAIVISHGHYDHIGGLKEFLKVLKRKIKVYIGCNALLPKFSGSKYAGAPDSIEEYENLGAEFCEIRNITPLDKGVYIFPKVPFTTWESPPKKFSIIEGNQKKRDLFDDELIMVFVENNSTTVVTGCSHRGIVNIVLEVSRYWKIRNLVGGLHLLDKGQPEIEKICSIFEDLKIENIFVGHCTGDSAIRIFKQDLNAKTEEIMAGQVLEF